MHMSMATKKYKWLLRFNKSTQSMLNKCNFLYQPGSIYDTKVPSSYSKYFLKTEKLKSCMYGAYTIKGKIVAAL